MQIYNKEKKRVKKGKIDKEEQSFLLIRDILIKNKNYSFLNIESSDKDALKFSYFALCKKYNLEESLSKDRMTLIEELELFAKKEVAEKLKKQKKKSKISNSSLIENALAEKQPLDFYNSRRSENPDPYSVRHLFYEENKYDAIVKTKAIQVFETLNKYKKLFNKNNVDNIFVFKALSFIAKNHDLWIDKDFNFVPKSKNINKTVFDMFNHCFFQYPISKNEMFLCENEKAMVTFINTKSMKKTIDKHYFNIKLTKKLINKIKNYKMLNEHTCYSDFLFEIKFNDIVKNDSITKELIFKNHKDLLIEYAYYIKNVILKEPMFSKNQISPLFDYALRKKRFLLLENKVFTFKNRCLFKLFNEMEEWHKSLHLSTSKRNLVWEKSNFIKEKVYENFKDKNKPLNEIRLHTNYSFFSVVELTNSSELKAEGRSLKHCVGSYDKNCFRGETRIFSLRFKGYGSLYEKSVVTIQVNDEKRITEARAALNKMPSAEYNNIIKKWANENNLIY